MDQAMGRRLLDAAGYAVVERAEGGIYEAFAVRVTERWRGWGLTPDDAYENLFAEMLPSHLAQRLLASYELPAAALPTCAPQIAEATVEAPPVENVDCNVGAARFVERVSEGTITETRVDEVVTAPADEGVAEAAAEIASLLDGLDEGALGLLAPDIQRIEVTGIAASARALQEEAVRNYGPHAAFDTACARVIGRLGDLCKRFWPGSVRALQRAAVPQDARLPGQREGTTWAEVAMLAQAAYEGAMRAREELGLDAHGYADTAETMAPEPVDAAGLLSEVEIALRPWGDAPAWGAERSEHTLMHGARTLRWIRGRVDAVRWAQAMGTLRRAAAGTSSDALRAALDARYGTPVPWSHFVHPRDGGTGTPCLPAAEVAEPVTLPSPSATDEHLVTWFNDRLDDMNGPALAALVAPIRDRFVALAARETFPEVADGRRFRRRLRDVVARLQAEPAAPAPAPAPVSPGEEDGPADSDATGLLASVLPFTTGKRVLLVSNKTDRALAESLMEALALGAIVVCDGNSPRRVQSACDSVRRGQYDLVLGVTGFMKHACAATLDAAAGAAGIRLIRVNRGRPAACIRALARDHGVAP